MIPVQISFHGVSSSDALRELAESRAQKLARFCDRIVRCRVAIEAPHHHHLHGNHYRVRIELALPGDELVIGRDPPARSLDEDAYRAVAHAFDALERKLIEEQARRRHVMTMGRKSIRGR